MTQNVNTDTVMAILAALYTPQDEVAADQSNQQKATAGSKAPLVVVLLLSGAAIAFLAAWQAKKRKSRDKCKRLCAVFIHIVFAA